MAEPDIVLNAVVGFAGLPATLWALERGVTLALANKESLVAAGELALGARERGGGLLLPVDSEHSAVFQCLEGRDLDSVDSIVLTASGGPFRGRTRDQLADVTRADALAHPTWHMGPKITVDSATLANKGLELIEAHFLFGLPYEQIEVVVHPTSVVHAIVRFRDGASLAHLGYPDMRVPISYALTYPERAATPIDGLDFTNGLTLEFEPPDVETFPMLALARKAGESGGTHPCAYNAANEVAVAAFLAGRLPFLGIAGVVEDTLAAVDGAPAGDLDELIEADGEARRLAERGRRSAGAVNIFIAIIGLSLLVLVHEAGHFFSARAVGMSPRRFYVGFPPALAKVKREGHRVRHRRGPARRLREDPGNAQARAVGPEHLLRAGARGGARNWWRRSTGSSASSTRATWKARALSCRRSPRRCSTSTSAGWRGAAPRRA